MNEHRNLLAHGVNQLLDAGCLDLHAPSENEMLEERDGHVFCQIDGFPSVVNWQHISFGEVRISVWWNYDHSRHPQANLSGDFKERFSGTEPLADRSKYNRFVGTTVSGWLERLDGKHLQGKGREGLFDIYTRRKDRAALREICCANGRGYKLEGRFFL